MARFASPELFTTAPSLRSACDAGRGSSIPSEVRLQHAQDRPIQVLVGHCFLSFTTALHPSHSCYEDVSHKASSGNNLTASTREVARADRCKPVAFVTDPSQGMYDRFGRTLAYLDKADRLGTTRSNRPVRVLPIPTSITAIPRREPMRLPLPNRMRRPCGRGLWGAAVLRPNDVGPNLIRRGAGRLASGYGRESTADDDVPLSPPPRRIKVLHEDVAAKLRLG